MIAGLLAGIVVAGLRDQNAIVQKAVQAASLPPAVPIALPGSAAPAADERLAVTAIVDSMDRVTRVEGKDPQAVLEAFCSRGIGHVGRDPLRVQPTRPFRRGVLQGVFVQQSREYAIWMRKQPQTGMWFVGTGLRPIEPEPVVNKV